ncbi:MAG: alpha/beta hydrolase [Desulfurivibrionaceae bacterium]
MNLIFVHGWSVTNTDTYGGLPEALVAAAGAYHLDLSIQHINLGRYISFHDEVTVDDIARALDQALHDLPGNAQAIQPFSCITHSTGGPVVRHWINRYFGAGRLAQLPLRHLVMLAPANHGSALAVLGKERVGRIKAWFSGVEPGQKVLDWLSLGSYGQWTLNEDFLSYDYTDTAFFPFVLTGQGIDRQLYDFLNNYLVEPGSDGVVRVAGANMNYRYLAIEQNNELLRKQPPTYRLVADDHQPVRIAPPVPLGVYSNYSHSGKKMGIMASITPQGATVQPVVNDILQCLLVNNQQSYQQRAEALTKLTQSEQEGKERYAMLIFNVHDNQGNRFAKDDFDVFLLAGRDYQPQMMPKGFFMDRQMNGITSNLVYYLNVDKMNQIKDGLFGLRIVARPSSGFSYYYAAEFRSDGASYSNIIAPNQTTYVDITLNRQVDKNVFRFDPADQPRKNFKNLPVAGKPIDN